MEMPHFSPLLVKINKNAPKWLITRPVAPGAISLLKHNGFLVVLRRTFRGIH